MRSTTSPAARRPWTAHQCAVAICMIALASCDFGEVSTSEPPPRQSNDVVLELRAEDVSAAAALEWTGGRIPGARVVVLEADTSLDQPWKREGFTSVDGNFALTGIPAGTYDVSVTRLLDAAERTKTGARSVTAFLHRLTVDIGASDTVRITIPASTRRALVISEFEYDVRTATGASYTQGGYIELYNNTDSIIYLDGKVIARGFDNLLELSNSPCASLAHMRLNSQGIYAAAFEKFPGSGRQHPLSPGRSVVVAVDAIDHRPFAPAGYDLSGAGFEFRGSADADNPSVPNMVNIGLREGTQYGLAWPAGSTVVFVSEPVDVPSLSRATIPGGTTEYALFPRAGILDVAVFLNENAGVPYCDPVTDPAFNRVPAIWQWGSGPGASLQRRFLLQLEDGRSVLQHTRSSGLDFQGAAGSPGAVPRS